MTLRVYTSDDFGAPDLKQLSSADDRFFDVFTQCLVTGYGDQTVSITRAASLVTITFPVAHKYDSTMWARKNVLIAVSGAVEADYNGEWLCEVISATEVTFTIATTPASPATGTITARQDGMGWTEEFAGTTGKKCFKQPTGTNGFYLTLNALSANKVFYNMYETMSAVDTGTDGFGFAATGGTVETYMGASYAANGSANTRWLMVTDGKFVVFSYTSYTTTTTDYRQHMAFGDIDSFNASDNFNTMCFPPSSNPASTTLSTVPALNKTTSALTTSNSGVHICRGFDGVVKSPQATPRWLDTISDDGDGNKGITYGNAFDTRFHFSDILITSEGLIRGTLPLLKMPLMKKIIATGDHIEDAGSRYVAIVAGDRMSVTTTNRWCLFVKIS